MNYNFDEEFLWNESCRVDVTGFNYENLNLIVRWNPRGKHYFFPYNTEGSIQSVEDIGQVEVESPEEGTLVLTSGMNGCTLDIRYDKKNTYRFYHDPNGAKKELIDAENINWSIERLNSQDEETLFLKHLNSKEKKGKADFNKVVGEYIKKYNGAVYTVMYISQYLNGFWTVHKYMFLGQISTMNYFKIFLSKYIGGQFLFLDN